MSLQHVCVSDIRNIQEGIYRLFKDKQLKVFTIFELNKAEGETINLQTLSFEITVVQSAALYFSEFWLLLHFSFIFKFIARLPQRVLINFPANQLHQIKRRSGFGIEYAKLSLPYNLQT